MCSLIVLITFVNSYFELFSPLCVPLRWNPSRATEHSEKRCRCRTLHSKCRLEDKTHASACRNTSSHSWTLFRAWFHDSIFALHVLVALYAAILETIFLLRIELLQNVQATILPVFAFGFHAYAHFVLFSYLGDALLKLSRVRPC